MAILVTGGSGFVGLNLAEQLLSRGESVVLFSINPPPAAAVTELSRLPGKLTVLAGDVTDPGLGISSADAKQMRADLTHIIHCAASVRFDLPIAEAAEINIAGALEVLAFAQICPSLQRLADEGDGAGHRGLAGVGVRATDDGRQNDDRKPPGDSVHRRLPCESERIRSREVTQLSCFRAAVSRS